nr:MAG TPA: DNA-directed RNA polymerase [Caudoviricetes sp.]
MKIIKSGTKTPPKKQIYVIKCRTCGCVFTYMEKDMHYITVDSIGVYCPECNYSNVPFIRKKYKGEDK